MSEEMYDAVLFYFPRYLAMCKLPGEVRESDRAGRANMSGIMLGWVAEAELHHGLQTYHHSGYSCAVVTLHHVELLKLHPLKQILQTHESWVTRLVQILLHLQQQY